MLSNSSLVMLQKLAFKIAMILVIVGSLNWFLVGAFRYNVVEKFLGKSTLARSIYIIIGLAAISMMFNRDTYLPFLGETVMPCSALKDRVPPGASKEVHVSATPGAKILYWAAEPSMEGLKHINDWVHAYLRFENSGIATADENGLAILKVRSPQPYTVPLNGRLEPHVHFRICGENGFLSRVKTVYIDSGVVEGF